MLKHWHMINIKHFFPNLINEILYVIYGRANELLRYEQNLLDFKE